MNLNKEKRYIEETDHVGERRERAEEAHQAARSEQDKTTERLQKLEADREANPMASLADQQRLYGLFVLLAAVLFAADIPIQYALNSVAFAKLAWFVLIVISVLVAAGLGVMVEVAAIAMFFDSARPRRTVRLCKIWAGVTGIFSAVAGTVLLFSRTATGEVVDFLVQAVPVSMWILGESLPIAAGFLSAAAWTLGAPGRRDHQIAGLKERVSELGRFMDWLDRDKQKHASSVVTMILVGCFLALPAFSMGGFAPPTAVTLLSFAAVADSAQSPARNAPATQTVSNAPKAGSKRCLVLVDVTESVDPEYRRQAVYRLTETLPDFLAAFNCTTLGAGTFADEGPFSPVSEFQVTPPPLQR